MKKLMVIAAVVFAAVAANAAATKWSVQASAMKGADGKNAFVGLVEFWATGGDLKAPVLLASGQTTNGSFSKTGFFMDDGVFTTGTSYDVYYVIKDEAGHSLTSTLKPTTATSTGTGTANFGNQSTYTSTAGNWSGAAPEPTSALLMLLGAAGLALRRRRR